jgi:uncharacterized membrane protein
LLYTRFIDKIKQASIKTILILIFICILTSLAIYIDYTDTSNQNPIKTILIICILISLIIYILLYKKNNTNCTTPLPYNNNGTCVASCTNGIILEMVIIYHLPINIIL